MKEDHTQIDKKEENPQVAQVRRLLKSPEGTLALLDTARIAFVNTPKKDPTLFKQVLAHIKTHAKNLRESGDLLRADSILAKAHDSLAPMNHYDADKIVTVRINAEADLAKMRADKIEELAKQGYVEAAAGALAMGLNSDVSPTSVADYHGKSVNVMNILGLGTPRRWKELAIWSREHLRNEDFARAGLINRGVENLAQTHAKNLIESGYIDEGLELAYAAYEINQRESQMPKMVEKFFPLLESTGRYDRLSTWSGILAYENSTDRELKAPYKKTQDNAWEMKELIGKLRNSIYQKDKVELLAEALATTAEDKGMGKQGVLNL